MSRYTLFDGSESETYVTGELVYLPNSEKESVPLNGFLKCDGSSYNTTTYSKLFLVLNSTTLPNTLNIASSTDEYLYIKY